MTETTARYDVRVDTIMMVRSTIGKKNGIPSTDTAVVVKNGDSCFEIPADIPSLGIVHELIAEGLANMREMGILGR